MKIVTGHTRINVLRETIIISISSAITICVAVVFIAQIIVSGSMPPFVTNNQAPSIGETGDFVGGWANSVALIWLVTVAFLQYLDLRHQREELKLLRQENQKQAEAASRQASTTEQVLLLERRRIMFEQLAHARRIMRDLLIDLILNVKNLYRREGIGIGYDHATLEQLPDTELNSVVKMIVDRNISYIRTIETHGEYTPSSIDKSFREATQVAEHLESIMMIESDLSNTARAASMVDLYKSMFMTTSMSSFLRRCKYYVVRFRPLRERVMEARKLQRQGRSGEPELELSPNPIPPGMAPSGSVPTA